MKPLVFARGTDPKESREAARSVKRTTVKQTRLSILKCLRKSERPMSDEEIVEYVITYVSTSPSCIRTQRCYLKRDGYLVQAGTAITRSGRKCATWSLEHKETQLTLASLLAFGRYMRA